MKTIVIPDIHQNLAFADRCIMHAYDIEADEIVFLGDFFDSFKEPPLVASFQDTCEYYKELLDGTFMDGAVEDPAKKIKIVVLLGNHDIPYIYGNWARAHNTAWVPQGDLWNSRGENPYWCTGHTRSKQTKFFKTFYKQGLGDEFFVERVKVAYKTQGYILSHAGVVVNHFPYGYSPDRFLEELLPEVWADFRQQNHPQNWLITEAGECRGGESHTGGVIWCDWRREFGERNWWDVGSQIVGHTTCTTPQKYVAYRSVAYNIDAQQTHFALIENEEVHILKLEDDGSVSSTELV